jgi:hypothetical protein
MNLISSVLRYDSDEAWTLSQNADKMRDAFERNVLRRPYGPVLIKGQQRNRHNHEMCKLHKETELTRRLQWVGQE